MMEVNKFQTNNFYLLEQSVCYKCSYSPQEKYIAFSVRPSQICQIHLHRFLPYSNKKQNLLIALCLLASLHFIL